MYNSVTVIVLEGSRVMGALHHAVGLKLHFVREWCKVARRVIRQRNKPVSYCKNTASHVWEERLEDLIQPKVILHFACTYGMKNLGMDFYPMVSEIYNMDNVSVYNIRNNCFISSEYFDEKLKIKPKLGKNAESTLILCDMPGVTVNSFFIHPEVNREEIEQLVKNILVLSDAKCLLLIAGGDEACIYLSHLLIALFNKHGGNLLMAGGIAQKPVRSSPFYSTAFRHSCLCVTFHGENVSANVAIHELHQNLSAFMENLSNEVGPLPIGAIRIAFMFSCINRYHMMKDVETTVFSKYFPRVPVYGLWSYGEFAAVLDGLDTRVPPMTSSKWLREECTSYLIITLKRNFL